MKCSRESIISITQAILLNMEPKKERFNTYHILTKGNFYAKAIPFFICHDATTLL